MENEPAADTTARRLVRIEVASGTLQGDLLVPAGARGLVIFVPSDPSDPSGRNGARTSFVAEHLRSGARIATLQWESRLTDELPLTEELEGERLAARLLAVRAWAARDPTTRTMSVGYYGTAVGVPATLLAASRCHDVSAVVCQGGRPDRAGPTALGRVHAPTLFIVGGKDESVVDANVEAQRHLRCESALEVVAGASPFLDESGALLEVARGAAAWFRRLL